MRIEMPQFLKYSYVPVDEHGWVEAEKYKPVDFDLIMLRLKNGIEIPGWYAHGRWDGYNVTENMKIVKWKRCPHQMEFD